MFRFTKFTLARQFMLACFLILLSGMVVIGLSIHQQIERGVINQTAAVTVLYVDSFISPLLQELNHHNSIGTENLKILDHLLTKTTLGQQIVSFKIWSSDGQIIYSSNPSVTGQYYSIDDELVSAFSGRVASAKSALDKPEHEYEGQFWDVLIETYAPVRADNSGEIIAVSEFYQLPDNLNLEIRSAQLQSWLIVGIATLVMYLMLAGMVGRASNTILSQRGELRDKVVQLSELLSQNKKLHNRVRRAANRTTLLNEQFLHRISSDLHDGPVQDIALAILRLDILKEAYQRCPEAASSDRTDLDGFEIVQAALDSSLKDIRAISSGLRLPDLEPLTPAEVTARAVRDYKLKTNQIVNIEIDEAPGKAPVPVKITLYRVLQEALSNGFRHASGAGQSVRVWGETGKLHMEIADSGAGFNPQTVPGDGHLGLASMRERVEMLGGTFKIKSSPIQGTQINTTIPLDSVETFE